MNRTQDRQPPKEVEGTPVEVHGKPLEMNGERWVTLVPPGEDDRLWEFSLDTGRIIRTRDNEDEE